MHKRYAWVEARAPGGLICMQGRKHIKHACKAVYIQGMLVRPCTYKARACLCGATWTGEGTSSSTSKWSFRTRLIRKRRRHWHPLCLHRYHRFRLKRSSSLQCLRRSTAKAGTWWSVSLRRLMRAFPPVGEPDQSSSREVDSEEGAFRLASFDKPSWLSTHHRHTHSNCPVSTATKEDSLLSS